MIAEVQCIPDPVGDDTEPFRHVDAAIAAIAASGLPHEVGALGTTLEGDRSAVWAAVRAAHDAALTSGARGVVTVLKLFEAVGPNDAPDGGPAAADLVRKHR